MDTWIGLNDVTTEGTYVWTDGSATDFTSWDGGAPTGAGDCVYVSMAAATSLDWVDGLCSEPRPAFCKIELIHSKYGGR